jgi:hypothetical protein
MVICTGHGCHHGRVAEVKRAGCQSVSGRHDSTATRWDCSCGNSYALRRCSACRVVSQVRSLQRNGEPWDCMWCQAPNSGFTMRRNPAEATLGDLAADMAQDSLTFAASAAEGPAPEDTTPVLIVTTNEIPGYRITAVHGDVFGLVVRARKCLQQHRRPAQDGRRRRGRRVHEAADRQQEPGPQADVAGGPQPGR